jgi:predicted nucleic acid-binding protein
MGAKEDLVLVDTNVFVIDLRYKQDKAFDDNRRFLTVIAQRRTGFTTTYNLLELCGILSFNLNERQLRELWHYFPQRYQVSVLPTHDLGHEMPRAGMEVLFRQITQRCSLGDAMLLTIARQHLDFVKTMATWDKDHFAGKFHGDVLTPKEFLATV